MKANGFTLLELMVGIVISMMCMIMMMMFFKHHSAISLSSSQDAEYDTQVKTGLLIIEKFVQNAGYGSGKPEDVDIGTYSGNPALLWRYMPNLNAVPMSYECQGITEKIENENGHKIHRLVLLKNPNCGNDTAITDLSWPEPQSILAIKNDSATPIFQFQLSHGDCRTYGIDSNNAGARQLTVTAPRQHGTGVGQEVQTKICLNNINQV